MRRTSIELRVTFGRCDRSNLSCFREDSEKTVIPSSSGCMYSGVERLPFFPAERIVSCERMGSLPKTQ